MEIMNIRFVDNCITLTCYGHSCNDILYINRLKSDHITLDSITEESEYSFTNLYTVKNDEWYNLENIDVYIDEKFIKNIEKTKNKKCNLVAMTLFKDDYKLIPAYVKYYKELGVEKFFMYYNKAIGSDPLPEIDNVTYIEWNYPYKNHFGHHWAQITAINDFLYWAKHFSKFVLFNDLDEFISESFMQKINDEHMCFAFENQFVILNEPTEPCEDVCDRMFNKDFYTIKEKHNFPRRSKCIINTEKIKTMGVHIPNIPNHSKENTLVIGKFNHVTNFKERIRVGNLI